MSALNDMFVANNITHAALAESPKLAAVAGYLASLADTKTNLIPWEEQAAQGNPEWIYPIVTLKTLGLERCISSEGMIYADLSYKIFLNMSFSINNPNAGVNLSPSDIQNYKKSAVTYLKWRLENAIGGLEFKPDTLWNSSETDTLPGMIVHFTKSEPSFAAYPHHW